MPPLSRLPALSGLVLLFVAALAVAAAAAPQFYTLDKTASRVGFSFVMGGTAQKGTMPVAKARVLVDPDNLAASRVDVTLDVAGVRTPLPFARAALVDRTVLDVARYPTIRFVSTAVKLADDGRLSGGATISGKLTIRGVTRPMTFRADLFRAKGSAPDDLSTLTVRLRGTISRTAFGATGYGDLVADAVDLDVLAVINAQE